VNYNRIHFYKDKFAINLLAKDLDNAVEVVDALDGNALVGVLSKDFATDEECAARVREYLQKLPNVSVGMGGGDPTMAARAARVAAMTNPGHVNQSFTEAMYCAGLLKASGCEDTMSNCMIYPTGTVGKVQISTGCVSDSHEKGIVDIETALCMMKDVGLISVKFFNMHGLRHLEELKALAEGCVKFGIPMIEPTGGIDPDNVAEIAKVCFDAGVERVMTHIYSSIIDKETGLTRVDLAVKSYENLKKLV